MKRYVPHLFMILHLPLLFVVTAALNGPAIFAFYLGAVAGLVTDPLLLVAAIFLGSFARRWSHLLIGCMVAGVMFSLLIATMNDLADISLFLIMARTSAIATIAFTVNLALGLILRAAPKPVSAEP